MASDKRYNGWTNYETWNVALWLSNEEGAYRRCTAMAQEAWDDAEPASWETREEAARGRLAGSLESMVREDAPDLGASMFADLLGAALSEVNWYAVAESYLDGVDKAEEADDDEGEAEV